VRQWRGLPFQTKETGEKSIAERFVPTAEELNVRKEVGEAEKEGIGSKQRSHERDNGKKAGRGRDSKRKSSGRTRAFKGGRLHRERLAQKEEG